MRGALLVVGLGLSAPALAGDRILEPPKRSRVLVHQSLTPDALQALLLEEGIGFQATRQPGADAWFRLDLGGYPVILSLPESADGTAETLILYAGFDVDAVPSAGAFHVWNMGHREARAFVDTEGDPVLRSDLVLTPGVLPEALRAWVRRFGDDVRDFAAALGM